MTQYIGTTDTFTVLTVKVEYVDPAGGFGGWFLHSLHQLDDAGIAANGPTDFPSYSTVAANTTAAELRRSIQARLERMFGTANSVTYTATIVQSVTPATIDIDF
jgi:hypothetical protein